MIMFGVHMKCIKSPCLMKRSSAYPIISSLGIIGSISSYHFTHCIYIIAKIIIWLFNSSLICYWSCTYNRDCNCLFHDVYSTGMRGFVLL